MANSHFPLLIRCIRGCYFVCSVMGSVLSLSMCVRAQTQTEASPSSSDTVSAKSKPRTLIISELRNSGPSGRDDAFVELANTSAQAVDAGGWSLRFQSSSNQISQVAIPQGVTIPPRGHFLFAGRGYSLKKMTAPDLSIEPLIVGGVQLRDVSGRLVDAVGPRSAPADFREGRGLDPIMLDEAKIQFACVRRVVSKRLRDTNDNSQDFVIVSVMGVLGKGVVRLGAPGPENTKSPLLPAGTKEPTGQALPTSSAPEVTPRPTLTSVLQRPSLRNRNDRGVNKTYGTVRVSHHLR